MNNYSLKYMLHVAVKYWIAIALAAIFAAGVAFSYINFIAAPKYTARGSIVVTNGKIIAQADEDINTSTSTKVENSDIVASLNFVDTVTDILKTSGIYKILSENIDDEYTFNSLMGRTSVTRRNDNTMFIDVSFTDSDPKRAVKIVNEYLNIAPDYINTMVKNASASIVPADGARWGYPSDIVVVGMGGIIGAVAMYLVIFFIYSSSNVIRDGEDVEEMIAMDVIGVVPDFAASKSREKKYGSYSNNYAGGKKNG